MLGFAEQRGFTLIELLVVVVLLGITAAIALPNFGRMIDRNQHSSAANDFSGLLNFARSEAIRRGNSIVVFPRDTGNTNAGYGVCVGNALAACKNNTASAEQLLRTTNNLPGTISISLNSSPSGASDLSFRGNGMVSAGEFIYRICGKAGTEAIDVRINAGGQIRMNSDTNVTCS